MGRETGERSLQGVRLAVMGLAESGLIRPKSRQAGQVRRLSLAALAYTHAVVHAAVFAGVTALALPGLALRLFRALRKRWKKEMLMLRRGLFIMLALVVGLAGCSQVRRAERSPETDALLQAARAGHADTVKSLLAGGKADVNGRDEHGNTPLIEAARAGHDDVVQALLVATADVSAKNDEGQTALSVAARGGHNEVIRLLRQAGASA